MKINCDTLSIIDSISSLIFSMLTIGLAYYVFVYQKRKDKEDRTLVMFKELIIIPKIGKVEKYFNDMMLLKNEIKTNELLEADKFKILAFVKEKSSTLRKDFLISIQPVAPSLHNEIETKIDTLTDQITNAITNDELKLCHPSTYEREIDNKIKESYMEVLKFIFMYNGE